MKLRLEFSKLIVAFLLLNGIAMVWASYYLAYKGYGEIAETLSKAVVTEILGVVLAYCCKAGVENVSKNTEWPAPNRKNDDRDC